MGTGSLKIDGREQIVGGFVTGGQEQIFLLRKDVFTPLGNPAGQPVSLDTGGINERGDVVGAYCGGAPPCLIAPTGTHGFLVSSGSFTPIDIPGALSTATAGINARGDIVGGYSSDGKAFHGFLLTRQVHQQSK